MGSFVQGISMEVHKCNRNLGKFYSVIQKAGRKLKEERWERLSLHLQQMLSRGGKYFYFPCGLAVHFAAAGSNGK